MGDVSKRPLCTSSGGDGEGGPVGVHDGDGRYARRYRGPGEPVVGHHQVNRPHPSQDVPHWGGVVGVEQARPIAHDGHRAGPVQRHVPLVAPPNLCERDLSRKLLDPPGEPEVVDEQGAGHPGAEDYPAPGSGDGPDALARLHEPGGRTDGTYAPQPGVYLWSGV